MNDHFRWIVCLGLIAVSDLHGESQWSGHLKYQPLMTTYPTDSYFHTFVDSPSIDHNGDGRLQLDWRNRRWQADVDYQLLAKSGDSVTLYNQFTAFSVLAPFFPSDERRLMDLTDYLVEKEDRFVVQRLDRLALSWSNESTVIILGRQAISWGNGLLFNPMDLFNPFDPTAVDKEYKTGDDMVYLQHLLDSGSDLQAVWVGRRNHLGDMDSSVNSTAFKYHGFFQSWEVDVLVAEHFEASILGMGIVAPLGNAVVRSDLVIRDSETGTDYSAVVNWSYSWVWADKNISGSLEYFRNGAGIHSGDYGPEALLNNPELLKRLNRGETFNLARDYLATSLTLELHPLWLVTPTVFLNLNDHSTYIQTTSSHDLAEDLQLLVALNLPFGSKGSEYGGILVEPPSQYLTTDGSIFAQLAWYF